MCPRLAVDTGQVAPVGDGYAQIINTPMIRIQKRHVKLYHSDAGSSRSK
jgi:hypothetical protein